MNNVARGEFNSVGVGIANPQGGDVTLEGAIVRTNTSEIHGGFGTSLPVRLGDGELSLTAGSRDNIIQFQSVDAAFTGKVNIDAGDGNDLVDITLLSADNTITAGKGNDRVFSGAGDDTINGGIGFDSVFSGDGDDLVFGGGGRDTLKGGVNTQSIDASGCTGPATLVGADGAETIIGS